MEENCPECSGLLVADNKEIWCKVCGLVIREVIEIQREIFDINGERIILRRPTPLSRPMEPTRIG